MQCTSAFGFVAVDIHRHAPYIYEGGFTAYASYYVTKYHEHMASMATAIASLQP